MGVPVSQMWTVASYVLRQKLRGVQRYPLVLMLEPLFRCNLACAGCGKIQHPNSVLKRNLAAEECFQAVEECGAPMVSIPGGEPLLHPEIHEIVEGLVERKKYIYLCTNAILLEEHLDRFTPSKYLTFSVHLDGLQEEHDRAVCRDGIYEVAVRAIRKAVERGFRVTTNTTLFNDADPEFGQLLDRPKKSWRFNQSPLFLEFLRGRFDLECTPWGNPTYNLFGWQKPCYLLQEGYCGSFKELMETTDWDSYGRCSGNPKCTDCMVHSGYEPSAVAQTFGSWKGFLRTAKVTLFGFGASGTIAAESVTSGPSPGTKSTDVALVQLQETLPTLSDLPSPISDTQADESTVELSTRS